MSLITYPVSTGLHYVSISPINFIFGERTVMGLL